MALVGRAAAAGWRVGGGSWAAGQSSPPSRPSGTHTGSIDRSEAPMSKFTRALVAVATLAAISFAGMTAVAHAQATDEPTRQDARRPPTQSQVGEAWHQRSVSSQHGKVAEATVGRVLARERSAIPNATPAQVPAPVPTRPNQRPSWVLASFGVLAVLLLVVGLAALAARRASRRARLGQPT
jgi:hypothetical protein